ncbi:MAG TPA: DUF3473 domain-containing protein [Desulfobacteraceae bacterium]|nr:DUF3473 domain-containing protein [Desulfobacteraceae bacterium]HPQ27785.1 DUF3473 domain-containing protein [Desulfobacteraceae bacterium]
MNQNTFNKASAQPAPSILFTVDVEDWFQVENFKKYISFSSWPSCELRVEKNTHTILDFLDEFSSNSDLNAKTNNSIKATFFILGWIAERLPGLVKDIHARGHEVASHGYNHALWKECSHKVFKNDLVRSRNILEDIIGHSVTGYRAPSFSIDPDMLKITEECGYHYDSSFNSFSLHARYGRINLSKNLKKGIAVKISDSFYELPVSNLNLGKIVLPWGGGGYFRFIPLPIFYRGVKYILKREGAYAFYLHPWEIDPDQSRIHGIPISYRFRHYTNLSRTHHKTTSLFNQMRGCSFVSCRNYLNLISMK